MAILSSSAARFTSSFSGMGTSSRDGDDTCCGFATVVAADCAEGADEAWRDVCAVCGVRGAEPGQALISATVLPAHAAELARATRLNASCAVLALAALPPHALRAGSCRARP